LAVTFLISLYISHFLTSVFLSPKQIHTHRDLNYISNIDDDVRGEYTFLLHSVGLLLAKHAYVYVFMDISNITYIYI